MSGGLAPSRKAAAIVLAIGLGLGALTAWEIRNEGKFHGKALAVLPLCLVLGVAGLVEPKLFNPWHVNYHDVPGMLKFKILSTALGGTSVAAGLYLAFALEFGWWLPDFILDLLLEGATRVQH
jgi:hypothetical protein